MLPFLKEISFDSDKFRQSVSSWAAHWLQQVRHRSGGRGAVVAPNTVATEKPPQFFAAGQIRQKSNTAGKNPTEWKYWL